MFMQSNTTTVCPGLDFGFEFFGVFDRVFDPGSAHIERLLREMVQVAFDDFLEAANGVFQ